MYLYYSFLCHYFGKNKLFIFICSSNSSSHVNNQVLSSNITSQSSYTNALPSSVTMSKDSSYSIGSHNSPNQNSISSELNQSQKVNIIYFLCASCGIIITWNFLKDEILTFYDVLFEKVIVFLDLRMQYENVGNYKNVKQVIS